MIAVASRRIVPLALFTTLPALGFLGPAWGAVTITAVRSDLLYSVKVDPDCSELFKEKDDNKLPFNIVRLQASADNAPPGAALTFRWSLRKPKVGTLAADLDIGQGEQTDAVIGMCASFGNACILTEERLSFYNEPGILWIAPTCDILSKDTSKQPRGGVGRIVVKVKNGKRKLGKAVITIGYGRVGEVTLFVTDGRGNFQNGVGQKEAIGAPFNAVFAAQVEPPSLPVGPVDHFKFSNGAGNSIDVGPGCPLTRFDACAEVDYGQTGTFIATVAATYADGSALCDNLKAHVLLCSGKPRLEVITRPDRDVYDPDNPNKSMTNLTVRLHNDSKPEGNLPACAFILRGADVLTCSEELKVGSTRDSKTTSFDFQHCSESTDFGCTSDAACKPPFCLECQQNEFCLLESHCSQTKTQLCQTDADCEPTGQPSKCPLCKDDERCIQVLDLGAPELRLEPGDSIDLLSKKVTLQNEFADTAKMKDTWTAKTANAGSDSDVVRYSIRGRPKPTP